MADCFEYNSSLKKLSVLYVFQVDASQRKIGIAFAFLTTVYGWNVCSLQSSWNQNIHLIIILEKELTFIDHFHCFFTICNQNTGFEDEEMWFWNMTRTCSKLKMLLMTMYIIWIINNTTSKLPSSNFVFCKQVQEL